MRKPMNPEPENENLLARLGYERRDIAVGVLFKWLIGLFLFIGVSSVIAFLIYLLFVPKVPDATPLEASSVVRKLPPPPNPLLQAYPKVEIKDYREQEGAVLNTYGVVVDKNGNPVLNKDGTEDIHIPITRAMDLVAEKGLPTPSRPVKPSAHPTSMPAAPTMADGRAR